VDYSISSGTSTLSVSLSNTDSNTDLEVVFSGSVYSDSNEIIHDIEDLSYLTIFNWDGNSLIQKWISTKEYPEIKHHSVGYSRTSRILT
jgi:hypothetical protein